MLSDKERLAQIIAGSDIDLETTRVLDAEIVSINPDRTVNIVVAGVPVMSLPSSRKRVGSVKVLRTIDGKMIVV